MTDDAKAAIDAALSLPGAAAPLRVLGCAADWASQMIRAEDGDDVAALECVIELDDALPAVVGLMRLVPELVRQASPGGVVSDRLAAVASELVRQQEELAAERGRLESVRDLERQVREAEAERDGLRASIEQLERGQLIGRELPGLRARRDELQATLSRAQSGDGDDVIHALLDGARRLRELTDTQRSLLAEGNDALVPAVGAAAEEAKRELDRRDELTAELEKRQREAADLREQQDRTLPALNARRQADEDLLTGLTTAGLSSGTSALERVRAELTDIERRIETAEALLKPLLRQHAQEYEEATRVRGLKD